MLRFTSRRCLSSFQVADEKLGELYKYHATSAALKPLIYRPKNANILLAKDLKDPETNAPLKPRPPLKPLSRSVLNTYIWTSQDATQLISLLKKWTSITTRKRGLWGFFTADHVQNILIASMFKLGKFSYFVKELYDLKPRFIEAKNDGIYDVEHFFNSMVMCQIHRNALGNLQDAAIANKKLINAWNHVSVRENKSGLANLLVKALQKQQGIDNVQLEGFPSADLQLPPLVEEARSQGKLAAYLSKNRFTYLMARTVLEFGESNSEILAFVEKYKSISSKLQRPDVYEEYVSNAKQLLNKPIASANVEPHPEAESS